MENYKYIRLEMDSGVALMTIDRPESLNALNHQVLKELDGRLRGVDADTSVKAVVLTGAGDKAFVSGGDIKEMLDLDGEQARSFSQNGQQLMLFIQSMNKPLLAAVNGYALGGGLELALACDFIYAAEKARFGLPEVTLGVLPGFGGTQNLPRLIGPNRAKELIFTGRILTANEALSWGIVNAVFPDAELLERTKETAARIALNASVAVGNARRAIQRGLDQTKAKGFRTETGLFSELFTTQDQKEGMQAFFEKRKPLFKGR
jgi:enoyl-CoA hydratase